MRQRPVLDPAREHELTRRYRETRDPEARRELCESNIAYVLKVAYRYARRRTPADELAQEGMLGLLRAIELYDPDRGVRFLTYARYWIEAFVRHALMRNHSVVSFGTTLLQRRLFFAEDALRREAQRVVDGTREDVTIEMARRLDTTPERLHVLTSRLRSRDVSLDAGANDDVRAGAPREPASADPGPDEVVARIDEHRQVRRAVRSLAARGLSGKERAILERRMLADEPETLESLGAALGVSRERVRQIEKRLMTRLREPLARVIGEPAVA
jgi:RNA polymerase sigma-32 factor